MSDDELTSEPASSAGARWHMLIPAEVDDRIDALAKASRRTKTAQVIHMLETHPAYAAPVTPPAPESRR